jgi:hypothetical protein
MKARICVATPAYGNLASGGISIQYTDTMLALGKQLGLLCAEQGWNEGDVQLASAYYQSNNIVNARCDLVRRFLIHPLDYTHMLFWDADVFGKPKPIADILTRLLKADKPIVGVPYVQKHLWWEQGAKAVVEHLKTHPDASPAELAHVLQGFTIRYVPDFAHLPPLADRIVDDLVEMPRIPIGFSLIQRGMLEKMVDHYGDALSYEKTSLAGEKLVTPGLFMMTLKNRVLVDEDYAFCDRWREMGGRLHLYVGPGAPLGHVGSWAFEGTREAMLADWSHR